MNGSVDGSRDRIRGRAGRRRLLTGLLVVALVAALGGVLFLVRSAPEERAVLGEMAAQVDPLEIYRTTYDLQNLSTRVYPSDGNTKAAGYLHDRLAAIPGLEVGYRGGEYRNVVATLRGRGPSAGEVVIVGAHYDSDSDVPGNAPGATDNGGGAAIVLELARIMSAYRFDRTVQFAFWNAEEDGRRGSRDFAAEAREAGLRIPLYLNYDSACYDPDGANVLDVMYDDASAPMAGLFARYNDLYGVGLTLTYNVHDCGSDHSSFWQAGYPAVTTHSAGHSPDVHSGNDTIGHVSSTFAARNARLGMLVLAGTAGLRA
jgi:hypothetical protein